jgi:DNA-binding transcriptional regulator YiaG
MDSPATTPSVSADMTAFAQMAVTTSFLATRPRVLAMVVRAARAALKQNQKNFAKLAGVSPSTLRRCEDEKQIRHVSAWKLIKAVAVLEPIRLEVRADGAITLTFMPELVAQMSDADGGAVLGHSNKSGEPG